MQGGDSEKQREKSSEELRACIKKNWSQHKTLEGHRFLVPRHFPFFLNLQHTSPFLGKTIPVEFFLGLQKHTRRGFQVSCVVLMIYGLTSLLSGLRLSDASTALEELTATVQASTMTESQQVSAMRAPRPEKGDDVFNDVGWWPDYFGVFFGGGMIFCWWFFGGIE